MEEEWLTSAAPSTMQSADSQPSQEDEWSSLLNASDDKPQESTDAIPGQVEVLPEAPQAADGQPSDNTSITNAEHHAAAAEPTSQVRPEPIEAIKQAAGHSRDESFSRSRASVGLSLADAVEDEDDHHDDVKEDDWGVGQDGASADPSPETPFNNSDQTGPGPELRPDTSAEVLQETIKPPSQPLEEPSVMDTVDQDEGDNDEWQKALTADSKDGGEPHGPEDEWARAMADTEEVELTPDALQESIVGDGTGHQEDGLDEWAKALGEESASKPKSNAFDEIFGLDDDDGLLDEDELLPGQPLSMSQSLQPQPVPIPPQNNFPPNSYTNPRPPSNIQDAPKAGPMKFFEDLPVSQPVRSRKARQQVYSPSPPSAPPPPASSLPPSHQQQGPPISSQAPQMQQSGPVADSTRGYPSFRQNERLDPFPPQPSVLPTAPTQALPAFASPSLGAQQQNQLTQQSQQRPISNSRYSPAPAQPTPPANKYSSSPTGPPLADLNTASKQSLPPITHPSLPTPPTSHSSSVPPPPQASSRYSPAPSQQVPRSSSYTTRETATAPPRPPSAHRFAPRTSSPLAFHQQRSGQPTDSVAGTTIPPRDTSRQFQQTEPLLPEEPSSLQNDIGAESPAKKYSPSSSVATSPSRQPQPGRRTSYAPADQAQSKVEPTLPAQSGLRNQTTEPIRLETTTQQPRPGPTGRKSGPSEDIGFVQPEDEQANDPLQRWKGRPIFYWSANGNISSSFPKRVPRFGGANSTPLMKSFPGDIRLEKARDVAPLPEGLESFPGPLRTKGKKKDVVLWLTSRIEFLEAEIKHAQLDAQPDAESLTKLQEKLLLLQILRIWIENDGVLTGNAAVETSIRSALLTGFESSSTGELSSAPRTPPEAVDSAAVNNLRQLLLNGDREKAVWSAADSRLWGHAMLISSTMGDKSVWKQVVQEFVRKEIRQSGVGNQSMAALYEILAGNWDESVDELVPASARAGFQMMSTSEAPTSKQDVRQSLDKWRETLTLVISNRSSEDENGLIALGKLLSSYGRIEAGHICYLFARSLAQFGGADDPNTHFTLLGANATSEGTHDIENILLSEVYEFAVNLASPSGFHFVPHLQAYKLHHAGVLAECGYRNEAQQYCEAIAAAFKATTKLSPYYHATLISQVDELSKRLSQTPKDGKSGWMSKPSIEKVSGSMWAKFNSFVAGDESEKAPVQAADQPPAEYGPFAGLTGGTPTISRSGSTTDMASLHHHPPRTSSFQASAGNSRYAPGFSGGSSSRDYSPHPLQQASRAIQPSYSGYGSSPDASSSFGPMLSGNLAPNAFIDHHEVSSQRSQGSSGYEPYVPSVPEEYASSDRPFTQGSNDSNQYQPQTYGYESQESQTNGYQPSFGNFASPSDDQTEQPGYDPSAGGYEPPASSYQPYEPNQSPEDSPEEKPKKKKTLFDEDEDDDLSTRAASMKRQQRSDNDRAADDAFKKAAEADAARDAQAKNEKRSSSWFGGFFGGAKKDSNAPVVHKAKLGEENSFYYDKELKKWVNKKAQGDAAATPAAPTPPPPRAGPPPARNSNGSGTPLAGAAGPPPSGPPRALNTPPTSNPGYSASPAVAADGGPPSRTDTPQSDAGSEGPPPLALGTNPPPSGGPPPAPPSRPATSMSNASSIDDLIGAPAARKGGAAKKGRKGGSRYVDVMGQK